MHLTEAQRLSRTGSFGWNVSTGEIFWSDETFRILQCDPSDETEPGTCFSSAPIPKIAPPCKRHIDQASSDGKDFDHEYRLLMPDGSVKYLHAVAHAAREASGNIEFIGAMTDVTVVQGSGTEAATQRGLFGRSPALESYQQLGLGCAPSVSSCIGRPKYTSCLGSIRKRTRYHSKRSGIVFSAKTGSGISKRCRGPSGRKRTSKSTFDIVLPDGSIKRDTFRGASGHR